MRFRERAPIQRPNNAKTSSVQQFNFGGHGPRVGLELGEDAGVQAFFLGNRGAAAGSAKVSARTDETPEILRGDGGLRAMRVLRRTRELFTELDHDRLKLLQEEAAGPGGGQAGQDARPTTRRQHGGHIQSRLHVLRQLARRRPF